MWLGPYVVSKVLSKGAYELVDYDGNKLPEEVLCLGLALFLVFLVYVFMLCTLGCQFCFLYYLLVFEDFFRNVYRFR